MELVPFRRVEFHITTIKQLLLMKIKNLIIVVFITTTLSSYSQEKVSSFAYGIHTDFLSVPLSPANITSYTSGVTGIYSVNKNFNIKVGLEDKLLQKTDLKQYEHFLGGSLGLGYFVSQNETNNTATEVNLSLGNSFNKFTSFKDFHTDLGLRFYWLKAFYIGTGVRYNRDEIANFITTPTNSFNWYWQMGLQFGLNKRK